MTETTTYEASFTGAIAGERWAVDIKQDYTDNGDGTADNGDFSVSVYPVEGRCSGPATYILGENQDDVEEQAIRAAYPHIDDELVSNLMNFRYCAGNALARGLWGDMVDVERGIMSAFDYCAVKDIVASMSSVIERRIFLEIE